MAGTRGMNTLRGAQLRNKTLRDSHFDVDNKINENKIDIQWLKHREILEDTKIDVFVQANGLNVAGKNVIDVSELVGDRQISTDYSQEGVVDGSRVEVRLAGTQDTPVADTDGDPVYGRIRCETESDVESEIPIHKFYVDFYSVVDGTEDYFTFANDAENIDIAYIIRTNLSVIPVDAIVNGGAGFVEGATDAKAYMNLLQLMKDLYGSNGRLNNDGNANLATSIQEQIVNEIQARVDADQEILDNFASNNGGLGASLLGVVSNEDYSGLTVQAVLDNLAERLREAEEGGLAELEEARERENTTEHYYFEAGGFTNIGGRFKDVESKVDDIAHNFEQRISTLETEDEREVFEAAGDETEYLLTKGMAKPNTLFVAINGALQVPGLHYSEITSDNGNIIGINFAPDKLSFENDVPDNLFIWYKKVI